MTNKNHIISLSEFVIVSMSSSLGLIFLSKNCNADDDDNDSFVK